MEIHDLLPHPRQFIFEISSDGSLHSVPQLLLNDKGMCKIWLDARIACMGARPTSHAHRYIYRYIVIARTKQLKPIHSKRYQSEQRNKIHQVMQIKQQHIDRLFVLCTDLMIDCSGEMRNMQTNLRIDDSTIVRTREIFPPFPAP